MNCHDNFDKIWQRILNHQGEIFYTITNIKFDYKIKNNRLVLNARKYQIPKNSLEKAYNVGPLFELRQISNLFGYSYIFSILTDSRINN